ncbi:hypothetical protein ABIB85_005137 [Bradyrhizobium sp. JR1.5]
MSAMPRLGAQDRERPGQALSLGAGPHEEGFARGLLGANRASAEAATDVFADCAKYGRAVECLVKDREALPAFYDFLAEHWDHLRTTKRIERVFASGRYRTVRPKASLSPATAKLMVFKLVIAASRTWRRLKGTNRPKVVAIRIQRVIESMQVPASQAPDHLVT